MSSGADEPETRRRDLRLADLAALAAASEAAGQPAAVFDAVEALSAATIGHRLFTIMRFDAARAEVERVHTSLQSAYPVGGRKQKPESAWSNQLLRDRKVFRATGPDDIRAAFDDHATILGLGLGSILNVPVAFDGRCIGTMNLCHRAGWYTADDEETGRVLAAFLVPALLRKG
jgi:GAF domain-containing protein